MNKFGEGTKGNTNDFLYKYEFTHLSITQPVKTVCMISLYVNIELCQVPDDVTGGYLRSYLPTGFKMEKIFLDTRPKSTINRSCSVSFGFDFDRFCSCCKKAKKGNKFSRGLNARESTAANIHKQPFHNHFLKLQAPAV